MNIEYFCKDCAKFVMHDPKNFIGHCTMNDENRNYDSEACVWLETKEKPKKKIEIPENINHAINTLQSYCNYRECGDDCFFHNEENDGCLLNQSRPNTWITSKETVTKYYIERK